MWVGRGGVASSRYVRGVPAGARDERRTMWEKRTYMCEGVMEEEVRSVMFVVAGSASVTFSRV